VTFPRVVPENSYLRFCETSQRRTLSSHPLVVVIQTAYFWNLDYGTLVGWQYGPRFGAIHGQRQMRAPPMVVAEVTGQKAPEVALAEDHHMIQAFPPDAPDHPLGIRILPGTPRAGEHLLDVQARDAPLKPLTIHGIEVAEQVLGCRIPGKGLDELLRHPQEHQHIASERQHDSPQMQALAINPIGENAPPSGPLIKRRAYQSRGWEGSLPLSG
jgi:hypothetical protein